MRKLASHSHAALMGFVFAVGAFSYALVTTASGTPTGGTGGVTPVGTSLRFTNPQLPNGCFDLGDAAIGFTFSRYVTADGGKPPYKFSDLALTTQVAGSGGALQTVTDLKTASGGQLKMLSDGLVTLADNVTVLTSAFGSSASPFKFFGVKVVDSAVVGSNVTGCFQIRLIAVDANSPRFAIDAVPNGSFFRSYAAKIDVIGGVPPYVITADAASLTALNNAGLCLSSSGLIFGKPIGDPTKTLSVALNVSGVDSAKPTARTILARDGISTTQKITLLITPNSVVAGDAVTTALTIKGANAKTGTDSVVYSAQINMVGKSPASFGKVRLVIAESDVSNGAVTTFDTDIVSPAPGAIVLAGGKFKSAKGTSPVITASLSPTGLLKLTITKATISKANFDPSLLGANKNTICVSLTVGDIIFSNEILGVTAKTSPKGAYTVTYKLGGKGNTTPGGVFLLTTLTGKDSKDTTSDSWSAGFVALPPTTASGSALETLGSSASVDVGNKVNASSLTGTNGKFKGSDKSTLSISLKNGKGTYKSAALKSTDTGIKTAQAANGSAIYSTQVRSGTFAGDGSLVIFAKGKSWSAKIPK